MLLVILIGLCIGSFLNVCIYRIAREESILYPPSHCTSCGYNLRPKDLVPVLSYLSLGGECRICKDKITIKYPIIEVINAILYVGLFIKYGWTITFIKYCVLTSLLIVIGMIDYETKFVYKSTINFGVISGTILVTLEKTLMGKGWMEYLIGAFLGFIIVFLIVVMTKSMGEGDVEIAVVCGLFLGWHNILVTLYIAFFVGGAVGIYMIVSKKKNGKSEIAFGPFLVVGAFIAMFYGSYIINYYITLL